MNIVDGRDEPDDPAVVEGHDNMVPPVGKERGHELGLSVVIEYVCCDMLQNGSLVSV